MTSTTLSPSELETTTDKEELNVQDANLPVCLGCRVEITRKPYVSPRGGVYHNRQCYDNAGWDD